MNDIIVIADKADMIINGYAFTKCGSVIRVLNLNNPKKSVVFDTLFNIIETTMDDIENSIVKHYLEDNFRFMEESTDA